MERLHEPDERILATLDQVFDPRRTPDRFVPYLATWVDLEGLLVETPQQARAPSWPTGLGRLRELIAAAAYLSRWRGTQKGLLYFLRVATGSDGFRVDEQPGGKPYHVSIHAPKDTAAYRSLITRIIEREKPAYVTYELDFV